MPLPTAADDHQLKNAEVFAAAGAAELRVQSSDSAMESFLASDLAGLLLDPARGGRWAGGCGGWRIRMR